MKRTALALALAAALLGTAAFAPSTTLAASCTSQTIGQQTYTSCYGDNGSYSNATTTQIGNSAYTNAYGSDGSYGSGTTTQIGNSSYSTWNSYP